MNAKTKAIIQISLAGLLALGSTSFAQKVPKIMTPFVKIGSQVQIEIFQNSVIDQSGRIINEGQSIDKKIEIAPLGSGTVISSEGLILTNYHVLAFSSYAYDENQRLLYKFSPASREMLVYELADNDPLKAPVLKYVAAVRGCDDFRDIAVLKIIADYQTGQSINQAKFAHIQFGNPYNMSINSALMCIGYPGKLGETVTITSGKFLGYTSKAPYAIDGSIKTEAAIAGGNSGGSALYDGKLIGLPTRVSLKSEKGHDFSYIHPVAWAVGALGVARMTFGERVPEIDQRWLESDYNTAEAKSQIFAAGKVYSAQSRLPLQEAQVLIHRPDRTREQIANLVKEMYGIQLISEIQNYSNQGYTPEQLAEHYQLTVEKINEVIAYQFDWRDFSEDAQRSYQGEFFFRLVDTDNDGAFYFYFPRHTKLSFYVEKAGFRPLERNLASLDGVYQDFGTISLYQY